MIKGTKTGYKPRSLEDTPTGTWQFSCSCKGGKQGGPARGGGGALVRSRAGGCRVLHGDLLRGHPKHWNTQGHWAALAAMTVHLAMGAVLLLLGPVQLMGSVLRRSPRLHCWAGGVYGEGFLAGAGGVVFTLLRGTIGGAVMNVGFGLYRALAVLAAVQTWRHAVALRFDVHRAWAVRLFGCIAWAMGYGSRRTVSATMSSSPGRSTW